MKESIAKKLAEEMNELNKELSKMNIPSFAEIEIPNIEVPDLNFSVYIGELPPVHEPKVDLEKINYSTNSQRKSEDTGYKKMMKLDSI